MRTEPQVFLVGNGSGDGYCFHKASNETQCARHLTCLSAQQGGRFRCLKRDEKGTIWPRSARNCGQRLRLKSLGGHFCCPDRNGVMLWCCHYSNLKLGGVVIGTLLVLLVLSVCFGSFKQGFS